MSAGGSTDALLEQRGQVHGEMISNMADIAAVWSSILKTEVQPWQVPLCMAGLKLVRASNSPEFKDHSDDIDGYIEIYRRVMGEDLK
jgi:hypothetical protein